MFEFALDSIRGPLIMLFLLAVLFLIIFTTSPMAALIGAAAVAIAMLAAYYAGVRVDSWARGGRG